MSWAPGEMAILLPGRLLDQRCLVLAADERMAIVQMIGWPERPVLRLPVAMIGPPKYPEGIPRATPEEEAQEARNPAR